MRWFPVALLLSAPFAGAQSDANQKTIRVEGTVLSLNGDLVRKAIVRLLGSGGQPGQPPVSYSDITDSTGKFVFDGVAPGRYTLSAEKAGFITARYGARSNTPIATPFNLTAESEMKDLAIKMTPQGVIAGKVLDQDGDPVVSAQVQAMRFVYVRGKKQLLPTGGASTNDLGEYRLIDLAPGRYFISATDRATMMVGAQARPGRAGAEQKRNSTTYYPNGADTSSAVAVDVAAGGEMRGADIRLLQGKVLTVRGKVANASGVPQSALVSFTRKEDGGSPPTVLNGGGTTQLRPDGTFEYPNITPGTYVVQFAQTVDGPANLTGRLEVTVADANVEGLVLPLIPRPEITGTLTLEDGDVATLLKSAQNTPLPVRWALTLAGTEGVQFGRSPIAEVNEDGTFRFNAVGANKYQLSVGSLPPGTYLKSARFGGQDVTNALIDTTSGTGGTLDLVFSSKAATVTGSVQNEKGETLAGMMVTLWPKIPDASLTAGAQLSFTDQSGAFKFQNLAPGDYYVASWEDLDPGLAQSAEFLNHFTSEASAITLAEGGQESRDLKPVPAEKVALEIAKLP